MLLQSLLSGAIYIAGLTVVSASPTNVDTSLRSWGPSGLSPRNIVSNIGNTLSRYRHQKRDTVFQNSTTLAKSWDGAVLLSYEYEKDFEAGKNGTVSASSGVEITCTTCYIKATVQAELTINGSFNATQAIDNVLSEVEDGITNITESTVDWLETNAKSIFTSFAKGGDLDDLDLKPLDVDFNIDIPDIPDCQLRFQFDDLELYVALSTTFSAGITYTLSLYKSETPIGIAIDDLFLGIVAEVELILSVDGEVTIGSGFHIQVDDNASLEIALFGSEVSKTAFNGGLFEFLPVTIESAGVVLQAVLRVTIRAGFEIGISDDTASAGVEVSVWAHIAELKTNVTFAPADQPGCDLRIEESYQFIVGAAAGATVALFDHTWGPAPETSIPIWGTTLTQCAIQASVTRGPITARQLGAADDLTTTTISTKVTYRGVQCMSPGLIDCPVSLQSTTKTVTEITLVTSVPSGVDATFPTTTQTTIAQTIPFGTGVNKLFETAGAPTPYSPGSDIPRSGTHSNKNLIIGVCVGVGGFIIISLICGYIFWQRRKRYILTTLQTGPDTSLMGSPQMQGPDKTVYNAYTTEVTPFQNR
ncbi:hypothetical protein TWF694_003582 [Orbilia ellipsospora]|uniref:Mid2 domain-containing protein n=1 Tax=Orbilia ellipsospora TaxID=2528407 RepID=A0AAV9WZN5_9PEZI